MDNNFNKHLNDAIKKEKMRQLAEEEAHEKSLIAKDIILEHMAGIYFRVEQLRKFTGKDVTVAEVVDKMNDEKGPIIAAVKYSWKQGYMLEAFNKIMQEDGETVDQRILGNLQSITTQNTTPVVRSGY
jgi:hypothetical protein